MTIWTDVLADVEHNRSLADAAGTEHDPEWAEWEAAAEAAMKTGSRREGAPMTDRQYRSFELTTAEFRDDSDGDGFTFLGVASVVDKPYSVRDRSGEFTETIRAGAFDKTLSEVENRAKKAKEPGDVNDVALFINHRATDVPMASTYAGTLRLGVNPNLTVAADLDAIRSDVVIARSAVQRGELRQMSIGFRVPKGRDEWNADYTERMIHEVALDEVSIVRRGANPHTTASMRSLLDMLEDELDDDELLQVLARRGLTPPAPKGLVVTDEMIALFAKRM